MNRGRPRVRFPHITGVPLVVTFQWPYRTNLTSDLHYSADCTQWEFCNGTAHCEHMYTCKHIVCQIANSLGVDDAYILFEICTAFGHMTHYHCPSQNAIQIGFYYGPCINQLHNVLRSDVYVFVTVTVIPVRVIRSLFAHTGVLCMFHMAQCLLTKLFRRGRVCEYLVWYWLVILRSNIISFYLLE